MLPILETLADLVTRRTAPKLAPHQPAVGARYQRRTAYRHHPGRPGVEPTRFGDWEYNGRCTDFG